MDKNTLNFLYSKNKTPLEFMFDNLTAPSMYNFITLNDVMRLNNIATSLRYSGDINKKYKAIDEILKPRDCIKYASGTNRVVYRPLEYPHLIFKIALDVVGIKDTPIEFENQALIKPFVTKVFEYSPCGTIGSFERVRPIRNKKEFISIGEDIFHLLNTYIIGKYILADIGTKYYLNYGIRENGFGPVLLDFPYVYEVEGKKLICNVQRPDNNFIPCGGLIDFDLGFNKLICTKCGKEYLATELKKDKQKNILIINDKEDLNMKIAIYKNGVLFREVEDGFDSVPLQEEVKDSMKVEIIKKDRQGKIIEKRLNKQEEAKQDIIVTEEKEEILSDEEKAYQSEVNNVRDQIIEELKEEVETAFLPTMNTDTNIFGISDSDFDEPEDEESKDKYEDIVNKYGAGGFQKNQKKRGSLND